MFDRCILLVFFVAITTAQVETIEGKGPCLENAVPVTKKPVAKLDYSGWEGSLINAYVAAILLRESGGFNVELGTGPGVYDWLGIAEGRKDVNLEVWTHTETEIPPSIWFENRSLVSAGALGVIGRSGWYMSKFAIDQKHDFASYRGFLDCANVAGLDTNVTEGNKGHFAAANPDWPDTQTNAQIIENLGLCLEMVNYLSIPDYLDILWPEKVEAREPFLFYYWEPTAVFARYKYINASNSDDYRLDRVSLPRRSPDCSELWDKGFNCDFESNVVIKVMSNRRDLDPELQHFYKSFTMQNEDQEILLAELAYTEDTTFYSSACKWVQQNEAKWKKWFWECPNDCFQQGICENGTCACLQGFEGEFCASRIEHEFLVCSNGTKFTDFTGLVVAPDLKDDPLFIKYELVCDEIIDCDNWEDEEGCSPSLPVGIIVFAVLISLTCLFIIVSLVVLLMKQARGRVRAAGIDFIIQIHIGTFWGLTSCFLFFGKASDVKCGMMPWWIAVPSGVVIASLVSKQYRVWKVFLHRGFFGRVSTHRLKAITVIVMAIDCIVLIIWSAIDLPEEGLRKVNGEDHAVCVADHFLPFFLVLIIFKFAIIFVSAVLAWKSREVPSAFSEAKHIGFALYNAVFLMVIFIPIILTLKDHPFLSWVLTVLGLWLWFFSIFLLVIGFVHVGLFKDRNKSENDKNQLPISHMGFSSTTRSKATSSVEPMDD